MAEISILPLGAGTEASTTAPAGTAPELLGFTAEGQVLGFSFDETLKQLLESQGGDEAQAMLLFAMQQPVVTDPQLTPQALISKDGNLLPLSLQADGKSLPMMLQVDGKSLPMMLQVDGESLPVMLKSEQMTLGATLESNLPQTQLESQLKDPMLPSQMLTSLTAEQKPLPLNELVGRFEGRSLVDSLKSTDLNLPNQPASLSQSLVTDSSSAVKGSVTLPLNLPVGQPGWDQGLGQRVQWMVNQNIQQAEIKLTPPNLGPLEIKISVQH
ncbi:MAG: flagellar hook-length control protein FliK, partial [Candidatus Thiodiazotropha sp.]